MNSAQRYNLAVKLMAEHRPREAAKQFEHVLNEHPQFEHGHASYNLAGCYEDLGDYPHAERKYREALAADPLNPMFLGGLASFTFLHGNPKESLELHLQLLRSSMGSEQSQSRKNLLAVISQLAARVGKNLEDLGIVP